MKNCLQFSRKLKLTRPFCKFSAKSCIKNANSAFFAEINKAALVLANKSGAPDISTRTSTRTLYHIEGRKSTRWHIEVREPASGSNSRRTVEDLKKLEPFPDVRAVCASIYQPPAPAWRELRGYPPRGVPKSESFVLTSTTIIINDLFPI